MCCQECAGEPLFVLFSDVVRVLSGVCRGAAVCPVFRCCACVVRSVPGSRCLSCFQMLCVCCQECAGEPLFVLFSDVVRVLSGVCRGAAVCPVFRCCACVVRSVPGSRCLSCFQMLCVCCQECAGEPLFVLFSDVVRVLLGVCRGAAVCPVFRCCACVLSGVCRGAAVCPVFRCCASVVRSVPGSRCLSCFQMLCVCCQECAGEPLFVLFSDVVRVLLGVCRGAAVCPVFRCCACVLSGVCRGAAVCPVSRHQAADRQGAGGRDHERGEILSE